MGRVWENREIEWVCGECGFEVDYQEEPPETCPNSAYIHGRKPIRDLPEDIKFKLSRTIN